jgi:RsiW-degrading membrane proteinase PrsW (M82 family)
MLVAAGGIVSVFLSLIGFSVSNLGWLGASSAGIVEEVGKLLTVMLLFRSGRYRYILNGLLAGAAVGAGFAIFESAGYAFERLLSTKDLTEMSGNIHMRALWAPFGHVAYTAIAAGALWRSKGLDKLQAKHLIDPRFLKAFLIPVGLHMLWNSPIPSFFVLKQVAVGLTAWFVVFGLVQQGLRQVKEEQVQVLERVVTQTHAAGGPY